MAAPYAGRGSRRRTERKAKLSSLSWASNFSGAYCEWDVISLKECVFESTALCPACPSPCTPASPKEGA